MNPNTQRALLLLRQARYDLAEAELRQALAAEPHDAFAHSLLALCLSQREQFKEATEEAKQAIHLAPDVPFAHYTLAQVLHHRNRDDEALPAIQEALRLDASEADYFALLAAIQLSERRWPAALEAAERGLQLDSEHIDCTNLRAVALVRLGRKREAGDTIAAALAKNPDNSTTHANQGWTLLEQGDPKRALVHFRESLRLDPENDWARRGIVEALKARHFIYAAMLRYFFFMSKLSRGAQWGIILGGYLVFRLLSGAAQTDPNLAPWVLPFQILYIAFALLTWIAAPLFDLLLRLNRFGRLALSRESIVASNWIGTCMALALLCLGSCALFGFNSPWLMASLVFGVLILPLTGTFKCVPGWPRNMMAAYSGVLALLGLTAVALFFLAGMPTFQAAGPLGGDASTLMGLFLIGALGSGWVANVLIMQRHRR